MSIKRHNLVNCPNCGGQTGPNWVICEHCGQMLVENTSKRKNKRIQKLNDFDEKAGIIFSETSQPEANRDYKILKDIEKEKFTELIKKLK